VRGPAPALVWPTSTLFVSGKFGLSELSRAIAKEVPAVIVSEKNRDIGAPGRATYVVRRGAPRVTANGKSLELSVPISATIDVCKPLGSMCLGYGHCEPAFTAHFRTSTELTSSYELPKPRASLEVDRRCVIGIDVTPEIVRQAERELDKIEQRIARERPDLTPYVEWALEESAQPQALGDGSCWAVSPEALLYAPPRTKDGHLSAGIGVRGKLAPVACDARLESTRELPLETLPAAPGETELWLPELVALDAWAQRMKPQLLGSVDGSFEIGDVRVAGAREGLVIALTLRGSVCVQTEVVAQLAVDEAKKSLVLAGLEFDGAVDEPTRKALASYLVERATWSLAAAFERRASSDTRALERARRELARVPGLRLTLEHVPGPNRPVFARVTAQGLAVGLPLSAGLVVSAR